MKHTYQPLCVFDDVSLIQKFNLYQKQIGSPKMHKRLAEYQKDPIKMDMEEDPYFGFFCSSLAFSKSGKQVFKIGKNLSEAFLNTRLSDLEMYQEHCFPYPSFRLDFPRELDFQSDYEKDIKAWICCIYITNGLSFLDMKDEESKLLYGWSKSTARFTVVSREEKGEILLDNGAIFKDGNTLNIDKQIRFFEQLPKLQKVFHLFFNFSLYMQSAKREILHLEKPEIKRREKLERRGKAISYPKLPEKPQKLKEYDGSTVTYLAPSMETDTRPIYPKNEDGSKKRRHLVMGFWNYYWICKRDKEGNRLKEKTLEPRWIQPYLRGSKEVEVKRKHYQANHPDGEKK